MPWGAPVLLISVRHGVLQSDVLGPVGEVAGDTSNQPGVHSCTVQFVLKLKETMRLKVLEKSRKRTPTVPLPGLRCE